MKRIGILSDTHGYVPPQLYHFFNKCDELWHAGDWGDLKTFEEMKQFKPLRSVWGNIDGHDLRMEMPEVLMFTIEKLNVLMLHIGGYPGKYAPQCRKLIAEHQPDVMICGHSHILKVMRDPVHNLMHINPGAAGIKGFHSRCTAVRLMIDGDRMHELEVWDMPRSEAAGSLV